MSDQILFRRTMKIWGSSMAIIVTFWSTYDISVNMPDWMIFVKNPISCLDFLPFIYHQYTLYSDYLCINNVILKTMASGSAIKKSPFQIHKLEHAHANHSTPTRK